MADIDDIKSAQEAYDQAHQVLMAALSRLEEVKQRIAERSPPQDYDVDY